MNNKIPDRVPLSKRLAYAAPAFALAVVGIPLYVYIPKFYTDVVGVNITILGYLLFAVRIFDGLTDPLIGYISDRTKSSFGRRRPYIAMGSFLVAFFIFLLFNPPEAYSQHAALWFAFTLFTLSLFWTAVNVPYESLGPEITFDYNERTTLFSIRDGFLLAGTLVAASSPAVIKWLFALSSNAEGERAKFFWFSVIFAPLVIGLCWFCVLTIKERSQRAALSRTNPWKELNHVLHNRPFLILLVSYTVSAFGSNIPATLILYYVEYVLQSNLADYFLLLYFVSGILFLPGWVFLSIKIGKKAAWLTAMAINTVAFIGVFFLGPGDAWLYGILVFFSGIGFGATIAIPSAMQADVIDYDELHTGERREGQYIGIWSISKKFAAAIGVGLSLLILGSKGYTPNVEQSEQVLHTLRILYAAVPSLCNMAAFIIALAYPISRTMHEDIRTAIAKRQTGQPVSDPLHRERMIFTRE